MELDSNTNVYLKYLWSIQTFQRDQTIRIEFDFVKKLKSPQLIICYGSNIQLIWNEIEWNRLE